MCRYTNIELADMHCIMGLHKEVEQLLKKCTWIDYRVEICQIVEHLIVFIGCCARLDRFTFEGVIRAMDDIAEFLQRKKQH